MIETAVVFDKHGHIIHWHEPAGRSVGAIPDSRNLWDVLWSNRERLGGVAHSHPWVGPASPSDTDLTTFAAVEKGLGRSLLWPIITLTGESYWAFNVVTKRFAPVPRPGWNWDTDRWNETIKELRQRSRGEHNG